MTMVIVTWEAQVVRMGQAGLVAQVELVDLAVRVGLAVAQVVARVVAGLANKPLAIKETVFSAKNGILCGEDEFAFLFYEKINVCTPF
jgi:hypothetical protein